MLSVTKFLFSRKPLSYPIQRFWQLGENRMFFTTSKPEKKEYIKIEIKDEDIEFQQVKGGGPGGQAVNKTNNCIMLKHKPTGIVIKSHASRDTETNKHYAIKMLKEKLDEHYNGQLSKKNQEIAKKRKQEAVRRKRAREKYQKKEEASEPSN